MCSSDNNALPNTSTSFYSFCQLCADLFKEPSYNAKTEIVKTFLNKGLYFLPCVCINRIINFVGFVDQKIFSCVFASYVICDIVHVLHLSNTKFMQAFLQVFLPCRNRLLLFVNITFCMGTCL